MDELLESYLNGNISAVKQQLVNKGHHTSVAYSFSELFCYYIDNYSPSVDDLKLFVIRLTD